MMAKVGNLDANLGGYFEFLVADVGNLYTNIGGYFELYFVMVEVDNLHVKLGGQLMYFSKWQLQVIFYKPMAIIGDDN